MLAANGTNLKSQAWICACHLQAPDGSGNTHVLADKDVLRPKHVWVDQSSSVP